MQNSIAVLANNSRTITMSSREISELVFVRHDNVRRAIETIAEKGIFPLPQIEEKPSGGRPSLEYILGKRDSLIVVAQLCPEFTARIVDRWQELEAQQSFKVPQTLSQALRLAAEQAETIEAQQAQLEAAKPAIAFAARHEEGRALFSIQATAKQIGIPQKQFVDCLLEDKFLFREKSTKNLLPYAEQQQKGLFDVIPGESNGHAYKQTKVTPKGLQHFIERYSYLMA